MREASVEKDAPEPEDGESDGEKEVGAETKKKLAALEEDMKKWDEGNSALYDIVGTAASRGVPTVISPDASPEMDSPQAQGRPNDSAASSSRRARNNAQHRTNDIELATEIGQSLLGEVRRLQALLAERDG